MSDTTICVSRAIYREAQWMPFVHKRLRIIRNGVHHVEHVAREEARTSLTSHPHLHDTHALWIGTIAELHTTKGLDVLIDAFAKIAHTHPDVHLLIMGEGGERSALEARITSHNLQDRAYLLGHVPDAKKYLLAFDIFTLSSRSEALGYALLEAGLAGLPAVASNIGGIPEIISSGKNGVLVTAGSSEELSAALAELILDTSRRAQMGRALQDVVHADFTQEEMIEKTLALY